MPKQEDNVEIQNPIIQEQILVEEKTPSTNDEVTWADKNGKILKGKIEKTNDKTYTICCKPDGKRYRIKKKEVSVL